MCGTILTLVLATFVAYVSSHGMMLEPPNRSSMWRYFPDSPPNYNDNENFCGGFGVCSKKEILFNQQHIIRRC